jgi:hypothetical protein
MAGMRGTHGETIFKEEKRGTYEEKYTNIKRET